MKRVTMHKLEAMMSKFDIRPYDHLTWYFRDGNLGFNCDSFADLVKFRNAYCMYFGLEVVNHPVLEA